MLYQGKNILVIGLGMSGKAAAQHLLKRGGKVFGYDDNIKNIINDQDILKLKNQGLRVAHCLEDIVANNFHLAVVSPGVPPTHKLYQLFLSRGIEIIGEIELAARSITQPCLGITGSNGKTTVTTMVTHVLNSSGICAKALGNVGAPLSLEVDCEHSHDTVFVLELSSFQLETIKTPVLNSALILNITPNHLDRHGSMEEYSKAKIHIKNCLRKNGLFYVNRQTYNSYLPLLHSAKIYDESIDDTNYDLTNQAAAFALCSQWEVTKEQFQTALLTYRRPPHRLQFIDTIEGVNYYNDSKATSIDAVLKAVSTLKGKTILIAGGLDKGAPYTPWITAFKGKVKAICAIGEAAPKIVQDMKGQIPVVILHTLAEAVTRSSELASPGDNILLSPGCASYDMFRDYKHRGEEFERLVKNLKTVSKG